VRNHWGFFLGPPVPWKFFAFCIGSVGDQGKSWSSTPHQGMPEVHLVVARPKLSTNRKMHMSLEDQDTLHDIMKMKVVISLT
jgi:hypothetical protein